MMAIDPLCKFSVGLGLSVGFSASNRPSNGVGIFVATVSRIWGICRFLYKDFQSKGVWG